MVENPNHPATASASPVDDAGRSNRRHHRRPRAQLSCGECRSKKLSCDRNLPCQRCVKSGKPERCSFTDRARSTLTPTSPSPTRFNSYLCDQIQKLRSEVAELRQGHHYRDVPAGTLQSTLPVARLEPGIVDSGETLLRDMDAGPVRTDVREFGLPHTQIPCTQQHEPKEPSSRPMQGYYSQHSLFRFFEELPQLFPLIKETATEHFKHRKITLRKAKLATADVLNQECTRLERLLPPGPDTEYLLLLYIDSFENVHRVVHLTSCHDSRTEHFMTRLRESPNPSTVALILSMIAISVTVDSLSSWHLESDGLLMKQNPYKCMVPTWIDACEKWLRLQNPKRRDLEYYQISCLVYLAKRMNGIRKKRYWNETGALVQEAVMDGLHRDPPCTDSPYRKEMKRRIWSTLRELDLQNSFEHGLPTLLHCLDSDVEAPANVEDSEFDEGSATIPTKSASTFQYTRASYQHLSARSWRLRLDISRLLYGAGSSKPPSHEDVLRYTHEITEALDALPPITAEAAGVHALERPDIEAFMSAKPFLTCQLKDCMLALHRHRLRRGDANFSSFSESLCYTMSKDILSLYNAPSVWQQSTSFLRADILTASLTITRIILSQRASQSLNPRLAAAMKIDAPNYDSTLALIEQCLPFMEMRYLLSFHGEPWCPLTILGAIMLIKMHLGEESHQTAKASIAERFLDLYYKHMAQQEADSRKKDDLATPSQPLASLDLCDFDLDWDQFMGVEQPGAVE